MMKVLVLGDVHLPYPDLELLKEAARFNKHYRADVVVCVGDLTDQKTWSKYGRDTDDPGNDEEWDMVIESAKKVEKLFPKLTIVIGNHDIRYLKAANVAGIPTQMIKSLKEALPIKGWNWHTSNDPLEIDGVVYVHGDESSGPPETKATQLGQPVVQGHTHKGRIVYAVTPKNRVLWGMDVACTADVTSPAFRYAKKMLKKAMVAFGTVTDKIPHLYPKGST
jgi:predicted phosphodiesterase